MSFPSNRSPAKSLAETEKTSLAGVAVDVGIGRGSNDRAQLLNTERLCTGSEVQACHEQKKEGDGQTETEGKRERKEERKDGQTY